jgi:uncharacterized MAPEG superfamily protein
MTFISALIAFGVITLLMLGLEIMTTYATQGFGFGFSSNRKIVERPPLALRIARAYQNQIESAAYSVPILTAAAVTGLQFSGAETAALLFVVGRATFAVLYYTGISFIRVPAFLVGTLSIFYIAFGLIVSM